MENNNEITPKEYVLDTMDDIKKDIDGIKKTLICEKIIGVFSASLACQSENIFKLVDNEWIKVIPSSLWLLFGINFACGALMRSSLNSLEVQRDALQEKLDLSNVAAKSKGNVNESRRYLVKKVRDLDENLNSYRKTIKLWLLGVGISFIVSMFCHDNALINNLGLVATYLFGEKVMDAYFGITRDSHIADRINITLDIDEVKRTRKLNRGVNNGK